MSAINTNEKLITENQNNLNHNNDIIQKDITIYPIQNDSNEKSKTLQNMTLTYLIYFGYFYFFLFNLIIIAKDKTQTNYSIQNKILLNP